MRKKRDIYQNRPLSFECYKSNSRWMGEIGGTGGVRVGGNVAAATDKGPWLAGAGASGRRRLP